MTRRLSRKPYLARREGSSLELKAADAMDDPRALARTVCALLNAGGGEVIVGVREGPRGLEEDPVPDPEAAIRLVRDRLAAALEPSPPDDLQIEALEDEAGGWLRIQIPRGRTLHVVKGDQGGFTPYRREDGRDARLSWSEVIKSLSRRRSAPRELPGDESMDLALSSWRDRVERESRSLREKGSLLLAFDPSPRPRVAAQDTWLERVEEWIRDPTLLGIRRMGWHYSTLEGVIRRVPGRRGWFSTGDPKGGYRWLELSTEGSLRFATGLEHLAWKSPPWLKDGDPVLYPHSLIESMTSCATLFANMLRGRSEAEDLARADLTLTRIRGWRLGPGRPGTLSYELENDWNPPYPDEDVAPVTGALGIGELLDRPHRLAWILGRQVYEAFGYEEAAIPFYDRKDSRFVFEG